MAREMMNVCLGPGLGNADKIVVEMPPDWSSMKRASDKLKQLAADAKAGTPSADAGAEAKTEEASTGGMMGMLQKGLDVAKKVADKVGDAVGEVAAAAFEAPAAVLDNAIASVEKPMSTIGQELISAKKDQIKLIISKFIVTAKVEDSFSLCQGPDTAISDYIIGKSVSELARLILPDVMEYMVAHDTIKGWDSAIGKYNDMLSNTAGISEKLNVKPIQLDIKQYICEAAIKGLCREMGLEETKVRQSPQGRAVNCPVVFFKVFNKDTEYGLMYGDYKKVTGA